jgi:hypothetical protein
VVTTLDLMNKLRDMPEIGEELTQDETDLINACSAIVDNSMLNNQQKLTKIVGILTPMMSKPIEVFKLCENSPTIKKACHENSPLLDAIGKVLIQKQAPGGEPITLTASNGKTKTFEHGGAIPSVDGKQKVEIVDS